jgi:hypothetical protein
MTKLKNGLTGIGTTLLISFAIMIFQLLPVSAVENDVDAYLKYVNPTVKGPYPDGINLSVPDELADKKTAALGLVDVTKGPFNADSTGKTDCTAALQAAINFARDHQMICFFPPGTYRVSDTLLCIELLYKRSNGRVFGAPLWPCMLVGSRAGKERPKIVLAPNSPGFGNTDKPKYVVNFWARGYANPTTVDKVRDGRSPEQEQPNISMNQMFVNLDITIGAGNAGAVGIRHQAAEGSAIEDCTIDATHGLTGIEGGIGSGGSSAGVTIIGGKIGLDYGSSQPTPVITGFTLIGQTGSAIRYSGRQTLVAVGVKIVADKCTGPVIAASGGEGKLFLQGKDAPQHGQVSLIDSEIIFNNAVTTGGKERVAITSNRNFYLNNVYVRCANKVFVSTDGSKSVPGNPSGWMHVREYVYAQKPAKVKIGPNFLNYQYPIYINGEICNNFVADIAKDENPPADLQSRHLWQQNFPDRESPGAVNVKSKPYLAAGDGIADDTEALQRAINENEIVFLPKGYYRLTKTLELKSKTKLIGVGQHLSMLVARSDGMFADAAKPAPLLRTADDANADTVLAFCGLFASGNVPGVQALHWRSGGKSVFRAVEICEQPINGWIPRKKGEAKVAADRSCPLVLITGHGGGNWYNFRAESAYSQTLSYRHILISDTAGPLNFYQNSPQHVTGGEYAIELLRSKYISFFGTKYEGHRTMLFVRDSDHIRHFGHGGLGKTVNGNSLFIFENTPNFMAVSLVESPAGNAPSAKPESGKTDSAEGIMLLDRNSSNKETVTAALERPALYKRGNPL